MRHIRVSEFEKIPRESLGQKLCIRLQAFDEACARTTGDCIFDWSLLHDIRALNYVGVLKIPGLTIEILPKIDSFDLHDNIYEEKPEHIKICAQNNLLYMLSLAKRIPIRERDLASLHLQKLPLLEALSTIFVEKLIKELRKGKEYAYVNKSENRRCFKGKILLSQDIRHNIIRKDRVFVNFDEFISDTWLNRILKATCRKLLTTVLMPQTQQRFREALLYFPEVADVEIQQHHFDNIHLNRNSERFRPLLDFCWVVLTQTAPVPKYGTRSTFSLLFPMETLFEEFIGQFIRKYAHMFNTKRHLVHLQAQHRNKWLLHKSNGVNVYRLKPDILIDHPSGKVRLILDTKWKALFKYPEYQRKGVSQADLYQLYAYAKRYHSPNNILLFPWVNGVEKESFVIAGDTKKMRIAFVDINTDLVKSKKRLIKDLQNILLEEHHIEAVAL